LGLAWAVQAIPLDHWTTVASGTTNHLRAIAFGAGTFVATGDNGAVLTSSNGISWTLRSSGVTNSIDGVAFRHGQFVAVGKSGLIITSPDGAAWAVQSSGTTRNLNAVTWGDMGFVAAGSSGTILISGNGTNWIAQAAATSQEFVGLGAGFGRVFVGAYGNSPALFWSSNGSEWSYMTNVPPVNQPDLFNGGFAAGDGVMVGVRARGMFCRSVDGNTWTLGSSPFFYCYGIAQARHTFVTVGGGFSGGGRTIGTSTNGLNWETRYLKSNEGRLLAIAYGQHRFVAVGDGGAVVVSDPLLWLSNPSAIGGGFKVTLNGEPGGVYRIQKSTNNFVSWEDVVTVTNGVDSVDVTLPIAGPSAFYRAAF